MTREFAVDNASILFLALMRKNHTNVYRFSMTLTEDICPEMLQTAVDRVYKRFPTIIAGFRPGFFHYTQFPAKEPPQVQPDPGCLITMPIEDIHKCAYRVLYSGRTVSIEAFHALTDGYGAIASFTTLVAEYLRIRHGIHIPVEKTLRDIGDSPVESELSDDFLAHQEGKPLLVPSRYAYQLPTDDKNHWQVSTTAHVYPTRDILNAAHRYGVSATTLLSTVMASSIMEIQQRHLADGSVKPVRIMVPVDLRRIFSSHTLRNFVLYALPTMEPHESDIPVASLMQKFQHQIRSQMDKKRLSSIMAYNVRSQLNLLFRFIPRALKFAALRIGYRFFGESNSSVTVTNLGNLKLPAEMTQFVKNVEVILTPRAHSPYGCAVISYGELLSINISTFCRHSELDEVFSRKLNEIL